MEEDPQDTEAGGTSTDLPVEPIGPTRKLSTRAIVAISVGFALVIGGAFWGISWLTTADDRRDAEQSLALSKSWKAAQEAEAKGVDFELRISDPEISMSFDHEGTVSVEDSCYQANSDYIVLNDGSLAIRDLTGSWNKDDTAICSDAEPSAIFLAGKLSFEAKSWVAYGADGAKLIDDLVEQRAKITANFEELQDS